MKFIDILELAKQGYTPSDIKELMSLSVSDEAEVTPHEETVTEEQEEDVPTTENVQTTHEAEQTLDYKLMYEESQKMIEKLQKQITRQNIKDDNQQSDEECFAEICRAFM